MTPQEFIQLKAFARQDGALLSLLWIGSFICYIKGMSIPLLGMLSLLLAIMSPFYVASRLRHFRDAARDGIISFRRGYAYTVLTYFYGGLLLAVAIFVYFAFLDNGYLMSILSEVLNSEQGRQLVKLYGMGNEMEQGLRTLGEMRPIDFALNMLTVNISFGFILGLPTAALMQRAGK